MSSGIQTTTIQAFAQPAPVSDDIKAVATALGTLAGEVAEHEWMVVRMAMKNLIACAEQVETMERRFSVPQEEA